MSSLKDRYHPRPSHRLRLFPRHAHRVRHRRRQRPHPAGEGRAWERVVVTCWRRTAGQGRAVDDRALALTGASDVARRSSTAMSVDVLTQT